MKTLEDVITKHNLTEVTTEIQARNETRAFQLQGTPFNIYIYKTGYIRRNYPDASAPEPVTPTQFTDPTAQAQFLDQYLTRFQKRLERGTIHLVRTERVHIPTAEEINAKGLENILIHIKHQVFRALMHHEPAQLESIKQHIMQYVEGEVKIEYQYQTEAFYCDRLYITTYNKEALIFSYEDENGTELAVLPAHRN